MPLNTLPMLKLLNSLKIGNSKNYHESLSKLGKDERKLVKKVIFTGIFLFLLIVVGLVVFEKHHGNKQTTQTEQEEYILDGKPHTLEELKEYDKNEIIDILDIPEEPKTTDGKGLDLPDVDPLGDLNPFSSFQESVIDAFSEIIQQGLELFDDYVAFTPNVANNDGHIHDARGNGITIGVDKFYSASRTIAFLVLPIVIVVIGITMIVEGQVKGMQLLLASLKKIILFVIALAAYRFIFSIAIDLNNAISKYVLETLVGISDNGTLSGSLISSFGLSVVEDKLQFSLADTLNSFGEIILWIGLFFLLVTLLFQFIIRFFHLLIHLVTFPIVLVISMLPGGGQFFRTYIEEILRTLYMQPIFLIGIGIALEVINSVNEPIPKLILGLGALSFLNIIPSIINKFSGVLWGIGGGLAGGLLAASTIGSASKLKKGITSVAGGRQNNSIKNLGNRSSTDKFALATPLGSSDTAAGKRSSSLVSSKPGAFKNTLAKNGKNAAFKTIGMKPLAKKDLIKGGTKNLSKINPDFSRINDVSLKDGEALSRRFNSENYSPSLGAYPLIEGSPTFSQIANISDFKAVNPQTHQLMESVLQSQSTQVDLGSTFDTSNENHWNHLTEWYAKSESKSTGKPVKSFKPYINNPSNKMNIIRKASDQGYFKAQGVKTVKVTDQAQGQNPINKYYQVNKSKK